MPCGVWTHAFTCFWTTNSGSNWRLWDRWSTAMRLGRRPDITPLRRTSRWRGCSERKRSRSSNGLQLNPASRQCCSWFTVARGPPRIRVDARYLLDAGMPAGSLRSWIKAFWTHPATAVERLNILGSALLELIWPWRLPQSHPSTTESILAALNQPQVIERLQLTRLMTSTSRARSRTSSRCT